MPEKIRVWNLSEDNVYVRIRDSTRLEFFNCVIKKSGSIRELASSFSMYHTHLFMYKKGVYSIPLKFVIKLLEKCPYERVDEFRNKIEENIEEIKLGPKGKPIKNPKLPINFSPTLARVAGHLVGDGGVRKDYITRYTNRSSILIKIFEKDILRIFGDVKPSGFYNTIKKDVKTTVFPGIIGLFLTKMFGKQVGKFKHVPKTVLNSNKKSKSLFLRALFDDESSVTISAYVISFKMANNEIVETIKEMLKKFGIKAGKISEIKDSDKWKPRYQFYICDKHNLEHFNKFIGFDHPEKKMKLKHLLHKYERYKIREIRRLIIEKLKKNGPMNVFELAERLNRRPSSRFRQHLHRFERENIINSITKGKMKIYYL